MNKDNQLFSLNLISSSLKTSFQKLSPKSAFSNPVMGSVWLGTFVLLIQIIYYLYDGLAITNEISILVGYF